MSTSSRVLGEINRGVIVITMLFSLAGFGRIDPSLDSRLDLGLAKNQAKASSAIPSAALVT